MIEQFFIPIVILSWPMGNVPPMTMEGKPAKSINVCQDRQEAMMYSFTLQYPEFWQTNYVGYCYDTLSGSDF